MDESLRLPPRLASVLAFEPVPVKSRRDGWTPARQLAFILRPTLIGGVGRKTRTP